MCVTTTCGAIPSALAPQQRSIRPRTERRDGSDRPSGRRLALSCDEPLIELEESREQKFAKGAKIESRECFKRRLLSSLEHVLVTANVFASFRFLRALGVLRFQRIGHSRRRSPIPDPVGTWLSTEGAEGHGNGMPASSVDPLHPFRVFRSFRGRIFFLPGLRIRQRLVYRSIFLRLRVSFSVLSGRGRAPARLGGRCHAVRASF